MALNALTSSPPPSVGGRIMRGLNTALKSGMTSFDWLNARLEQKKKAKMLEEESKRAQEAHTARYQPLSGTPSAPATPYTVLPSESPLARGFQTEMPATTETDIGKTTPFATLPQPARPATGGYKMLEDVGVKALGGPVDTQLMAELERNKTAATKARTPSGSSALEIANQRRIDMTMDKESQINTHGLFDEASEGAIKAQERAAGIAVGEAFGHEKLVAMLGYSGTPDSFKKHIADVIGGRNAYNSLPPGVKRNLDQLADSWVTLHYPEYAQGQAVSQ